MSKKESPKTIITHCIWFSDLNCPIRREMEERKLLNQTIKPKEEDTFGLSGMVAGMMQAIPMDLTVLPAYCNVCHLRGNKLTSLGYKVK